MKRYLFILFLLPFFVLGCIKKPVENKLEITELPKVTTTIVSGITDTMALSGGNVLTDGGSPILVRGVVFGLDSLPNLSNADKTFDSSGVGNYVSTLRKLSPNTKYFVRAYTTNIIGTAYGNTLSFFTKNISTTLPQVITTAISDLTYSSATSGGNVTNDGGLAILLRGVVYGLDSLPDPSTANKTSDSSGRGVFVSTLKDLSPKTKYFVRAYATNGMGTAYGNSISFITNDLPYGGNQFKFFKDQSNDTLVYQGTVEIVPGGRVDWYVTNKFILLPGLDLYIRFYALNGIIEGGEEGGNLRRFYDGDTMHLNYSSQKRYVFFARSYTDPLGGYVRYSDSKFDLRVGGTPITPGDDYYCRWGLDRSITNTTRWLKFNSDTAYSCQFSH